MVFREATVHDIDKMHQLRLSVKENVLITHTLVTREHYIRYLTTDGKGWVCEINSEIAGLAIVDLKGNNVWGLFVGPEFEKSGIGKQLQNLMLDWYFTQTEKTIWLSTERNSRAEKFYSLTGWKNAGILQNGEVKFEMTFSDWRNIRSD